jgi:uncharacterized protein
MHCADGPFHQIFSIPFENSFLIFSPLHNLAGLFDHQHLSAIVHGLQKSTQFSGSFSPTISKLISDLSAPVAAVIPPTGAITHPLFLGLITTWQCNMACLYCDFVHSNNHRHGMSLEIAKAGLDSYFDILASAQIAAADIQFFGGEPFIEKELVAFTVAYARKIGETRNIRTNFEATTNGLFSTTWCHWVADNFDCITLSLDGSRKTQDHFRPSRAGDSSFEQVFKNAKILAASGVELSIRICVSDLNVMEMEETARWISENITCDAVCFEALVASDLSKKNKIKTPDPYQFANNYCQAERILNRRGINVITSGTNIEKVQTSFCPLGKDALIITPEGSVNACYLNEDRLKKVKLDLHLGHLACQSFGCSHFELDQFQIDMVRKIANSRSPLCANCFCKYSCAGGCYVNHHTAVLKNQVDDVCIQTRLITVAKILDQINATDLREQFISNMEQYKTIVQGSDFRLIKEVYEK